MSIYSNCVSMRTKTSDINAQCGSSMKRLFFIKRLFAPFYSYILYQENSIELFLFIILYKKHGVNIDPCNK